MVESINGRGSHFRDFIEARDVGRGTPHRVIRYTHDLWEREGKAALEKLGEFPEFDTKSVLASNLVDKNGRGMTLLIVPQDCPYLGETRGLPAVGRTFITLAKRKESSFDPFKFVILANSKAEAINATKGRLRAIKSAHHSSDFDISGELVTPEEFINEAKVLILAGKRLPSSIMQYSDLDEFERRVIAQRRLKSSGNPEPQVLE